MDQWYTSKVLRGNQSGRTINFPTVNLYPTIIPQETKQGVYASIVRYQEQLYKGALYFGPRLVVGETKIVLEIYILDFDKEIYDETIEFQIKDFIRGVQDFDSFEEMKRELQEDVQKVKTLLTT
ncbi:MAG TPA: riboflavin kinase [Candidatus Saccharimonadales bacterium]|nr:riboflavin kinase [Candidatus Saccharimonadales bacterium]